MECWWWYGDETTPAAGRPGTPLQYNSHCWFYQIGPTLSLALQLTIKQSADNVFVKLGTEIKMTELLVFDQIFKQEYAEC